MDSSNEMNSCRDIIPYRPLNIIQIVQEQNKIRTMTVGTIPISSFPLNGVVTSGVGKLLQQLAERKRRLVNAKVIGYALVSFVIVPSKGEANLYTINLNKNGVEPADLYGLNHKFYDMLQEWVAEFRIRPSGKRDTFYYHVNKSKESRSVGDVRRHILQGFENLKVEVDPKTNELRLSTVGVREKRSNKRKLEGSSTSEKEFGAKKLKSNNEEQCNYEVPVENKLTPSEVSKFLADAWSNLMNMDGKYKDQIGTSEEPIIKSKLTPRAKYELEKFRAEARPIKVATSEGPIKSKVTPREKYEVEKFLADSWNNLMNSGNQQKNKVPKFKKVHSNDKHQNVLKTREI